MSVVTVSYDADCVMSENFANQQMSSSYSIEIYYKENCSFSRMALTQLKDITEGKGMDSSVLQYHKAPASKPFSHYRDLNEDGVLDKLQTVYHLSSRDAVISQYNGPTRTVPQIFIEVRIEPDFLEQFLSSREFEDVIYQYNLLQNSPELHVDQHHLQDNILENQSSDSKDFLLYVGGSGDLSRMITGVYDSHNNLVSFQTLLDAINDAVSS